MARVVEICVESAEGAEAAWRGGADRVEVCAARAVGGVTPGAEEVSLACRNPGLPVSMLIRPRAGDFVYGGDEFGRMALEIAGAKALGASGVVLGLLHPDGTIDLARTAALVAVARPLAVTFHKAFDETPDPFAALDALIALGIERVLTSGQAATARLGLPRLADLTRRAAGRIVVMAGGRIEPGDLPGLSASGVEEIHAGSGVFEGGRTDAGRVRDLVAAWTGRRH